MKFVTHTHFLSQNNWGDKRYCVLTVQKLGDVSPPHPLNSVPAQMCISNARPKRYFRQTWPEKPIKAVTGSSFAILYALWSTFLNLTLFFWMIYSVLVTSQWRNVDKIVLTPMETIMLNFQNHLYQPRLNHLTLSK